MGTKNLNSSLSSSIRLLKITMEENFKNSTWMRESCTPRAVSESRQLSKKNKFTLIRMSLAAKSIFCKRSSFSLLGRSSKVFQALSQLDWTSQIISLVAWSKISRISHMDQTQTLKPSNSTSNPKDKWWDSRHHLWTEISLKWCTSHWFLRYRCSLKCISRTSLSLQITRAKSKLKEKTRFWTNRRAIKVTSHTISGKI